jgi:hypothetical protein
MMQRFTLSVFVFVFVSSLISLAPRSHAVPADGGMTAVQPFLTDQTFAVVRLDTTRVDMKAAQKWLGDNLRAGVKPGDKAAAAQVDAALAQLSKNFATAEAFLGEFRKAGGREMVVVFNLTDPFTEPPPVIMPLGQGANVDALTKLFMGEAERVGDVLVGGSAEGRARARATHDDKGKNPPHKELADGLAAMNGNDAALRAVLAPSPDARKSWEQLAPQLPPELGGGPITDLTRGLRFATVTGSTPPKTSLRVVIQSPDANAAETLDKAVDRLIAAGQKALAGEKAPQSIIDLLPKLAPQRGGDRLTVAIEGAQADELARSLAPGLIRAREQALGVQSLSNARQLVMACHIWQAERKGEWPDDLKAAVKNYAEAVGPSILDNPLKPGTGYTYIKPPSGMKANNIPSERIVLYATEPAPDGGRAVAFGDGHAEWMTGDTFKQKLDAQQEADKKRATEKK